MIKWCDGELDDDKMANVKEENIMVHNISKEMNWRE